MKRLLGLIRKAPWHFFAVAILNVDLVVMPTLRYLGVRGWWLFGICAVAVSIEFHYWFWLTGTTLKNPTRFQYLVYSFVQFLDGWLADATHFTNGYINGTLKVMGWAVSHLAMITWGAAPFALWAPGLVFCKAKRWQSGYWSMFMGNLIKVGYFILGWEVVFSLIRSLSVSS
ncbi:MAG: hypothetical protein AAB561_00780 [Patescibacteria group bacterium]